MVRLRLETVGGNIIYVNTFVACIRKTKDASSLGTSESRPSLRFNSQPIYVGIIIKTDLSELFIRFTCPYIAKGSNMKSTDRKFKEDINLINFLRQPAQELLASFCS